MRTAPCASASRRSTASGTTLTPKQAKWFISQIHVPRIIAVSIRGTFLLKTPDTNRRTPTTREDDRLKYRGHQNGRNLACSPSNNVETISGKGLNYTKYKCSFTPPRPRFRSMDAPQL